MLGWSTCRIRKSFCLIYVKVKVILRFYVAQNKISITFMNVKS